MKKTKSKTKNNHFVSRFFSNNFREEKGLPMYVLNCKTGNVSSRNTKENDLFAKKGAWGQQLEDGFDSNIEKDVSVLIKEIISLPLANFNKSLMINSLSSKYKKIFSLILQTTIFQVANMEDGVSEETEDKITDVLKSEINLEGNIFLVRYNKKYQKEEPLLLADNVSSIYICPPIDITKSAGSVSFFIPINSTYLLFLGSTRAVLHFASIHYRPHLVNLYKSCFENKNVSFASQNKLYLDYFSKVYKHNNFNDKCNVIPSSVRTFI